jgi:hypothetical protein
MNPKAVPFFSQWETPELTNAVLTEGAGVALAKDPKWQSSGARSLEEYVTWASNVCGMACLKMVLAARTGRIVPTLELARRCTEYGGYTVSETGEIKGLIYAPFVEFVRHEFGMGADVVTRVTAGDLSRILEASAFFMASVHPSIRWPDREPPAKGGHLVLILEASRDWITFHNPSGHIPDTQAHVTLPVAVFDAFFAGRGVAIHGERSLT